MGVDEVERLLELGFGFAREASHYIGTDGDIVDQPGSQVETARVVIGAVLTIHTLQHRI